MWRSFAVSTTQTLQGIHADHGGRSVRALPCTGGCGAAATRARVVCARADLNRHGPTAARLSKIFFSDIAVELEENRDLRPADLVPVICIVEGARRYDCLP